MPDVDDLEPVALAKDSQKLEMLLQVASRVVKVAKANGPEGLATVRGYGCDVMKRHVSAGKHESVVLQVALEARVHGAASPREHGGNGCLAATHAVHCLEEFQIVPEQAAGLDELGRQAQVASCSGVGIRMVQVQDERVLKILVIVVRDPRVSARREVVPQLRVQDNRNDAFIHMEHVVPDLGSDLEWR